MAFDTDGDIGVDVAIIGGGIMGHYLARQLADEYSICMVTDPSVRVETLESEGYFSAGYDGNDIGRIQPARRAAGYWRLWAESNGIAHDHAQARYALSEEDEAPTTRLWSDAALSYRKDVLPTVFERGSIAGDSAYVVENDLVLNPADVLRKLRSGFERCCLDGEVVKFAMASDEAIEYLEIDLAGELIPVMARYTVLAASGGNAGLLNKLALRRHDPAIRRDAVEHAKTCQAVRKRHLLCIRGDSLPSVAGRYGGLHIASHPASGSMRRIWIVNPPIDDHATTLGQEDLRFEPAVDGSIVSDTVAKLFAMSPELERLAPELEWSVYVRRKTEHPMMASPDTSDIGQPSPAKIETMGLEGFMALWPSHLSYSMVVGDVAAERIREALGPRAPDTDDLTTLDLARSDPEMVARWDRSDFPWTDWATFASTHDL